MTLQTTTNINVDFYDKKYIMINAKQYDDCSRWISIICYDNGKLFNLSSSKHTAYIRYRKADGNGILNSCRINVRGEVLVELTEQMLSADGICYVDLIIVNKGSAIVNIDTGEIVTIDDSAIISTMAFCINVYEAAFDNSVAESSDEYIALNDALKMANAEYKEVIRLSKSYAVGDANNIRENENFDNSKYYSKLSHASADNAEDAKIAAENAQSAAETAQQKAEEAQNAAKTAQTAAEQAQQNAEQAASTAAQDTVNNTLSLINDYVTASQESAINAANSEKAAATSVTNAKVSEQAAANSATNAYTSETKAFTSEANASASEANALGYMDIAKSYAVGGTSIRENEDMDNAKYYYELANSIAENLNSNMATVDEVKEYLGI